MKDAVSYWYCNLCATEFQVEEEPGYGDLAELGQAAPKPMLFCPFCGSDNIEAQD